MVKRTKLESGSTSDKSGSSKEQRSSEVKQTFEGKSKYVFGSVGKDIQNATSEKHEDSDKGKSGKNQASPAVQEASVSDLANSVDEHEAYLRAQFDAKIENLPPEKVDELEANLKKVLSAKRTKLTAILCTKTGSAVPVKRWEKFLKPFFDSCDYEPRTKVEPREVERRTKNKLTGLMETKKVTVEYVLTLNNLKQSLNRPIQDVIEYILENYQIDAEFETELKKVREAINSGMNVDFPEVLTKNHKEEIDTAKAAANAELRSQNVQLDSSVRGVKGDIALLQYKLHRIAILRNTKAFQDLKIKRQEIGVTEAKFLKAEKQDKLHNIAAKYCFSQH